MIFKTSDLKDNIDEASFMGRQPAIPLFKWKAQVMRENAERLDKLAEFLEEFEKANDKLDRDVELILYEMAIKIKTFG